jgi:hypothetical protein
MDLMSESEMESEWESEMESEWESEMEVTA